MERGRSPVVGRDLIVRTRQCMNTAAYDLGEAFEAGGRIPALGDDTANQAEDVPDAMIELGNQQFLAFLCVTPLRLGEAGEPQDHFQQANAQRLGDAAFDRQPMLRLAAHRLPP